MTNVDDLWSNMDVTQSGALKHSGIWGIHEWVATNWYIHKWVSTNGYIYKWVSTKGYITIGYPQMSISTNEYPSRGPPGLSPPNYHLILILWYNSLRGARRGPEVLVRRLVRGTHCVYTHFWILHCGYTLLWIPICGYPFVDIPIYGYPFVYASNTSVFQCLTLSHILIWQ